jgi:hypothetical protein
MSAVQPPKKEAPKRDIQWADVCFHSLLPVVSADNENLGASRCRVSYSCNCAYV